MMKLRSPNTDWERSIIGVYTSSILHRGKGLVSLWSWLLEFFGDPSHCYAVLSYTTHIEIPTMLQPKTWLFQGKYWLVVPSKQQPGDNHETTVFLNLFLGCDNHGLDCNNHTPTNQHRVMHIYYYLLLFSSVFSFYCWKNFNKSTCTCKCMHA